MKEKILIFGAYGQLGTSLSELLGGGYEIDRVGREEVDITDGEAVQGRVEQAQPVLVVNTAAYNKVEEAQRNPEEAFCVNALGPFYIARAARDHKASVVHVSTDYVFDGSKERFAESDCPRPLNVYGASKLSGEEMIRIANDNHYIIRTSALFGARARSGDANFVTRILEQAKAGKPLSVVDDQWTAPTFTDDLAKGIKGLLDSSAPSGVYHITGGGEASWYEFAREILAGVGLSPPLAPVSTEPLPERAVRPRRSVLENRAVAELHLEPLPDWRDALKRYLVQMGEENI